MTTLNEALKQIEDTLRHVDDPIVLYQPHVGRELHDILRRIRKEKREEVIDITRKI